MGKEANKLIYFKELAQAIVGDSSKSYNCSLESKICKAGWKAGNLGGISTVQS